MTSLLKLILPNKYREIQFLFKNSFLSWVHSRAGDRVHSLDQRISCLLTKRMKAPKKKRKGGGKKQMHH